jgi:hypothetical protein
MIAHFNYDEAIREKKPFYEKYPLPYKNIKTLISRGFDIVNHYSILFRAQQSSEEFLSYEKKDYLFILNSVNAYLEAERLRWEKPGTI